MTRASWLLLARLFLVHLFSNLMAPCRQAHRRTAPAPNPGSPGSRKLSVPGRVHSIPKSYGSLQRVRFGGQPVSDSRHGRIACKMVHWPIVVQENPRPQSSLRAQGPTPLLVGEGSLKFS